MSIKLSIIGSAGRDLFEQAKLSTRHMNWMSEQVKSYIKNNMKTDPM